MTKGGLAGFMVGNLIAMAVTHPVSVFTRASFWSCFVMLSLLVGIDLLRVLNPRRNTRNG